MCSDELLISNGACGLNVGKSRIYENKLQKYFEEIRTSGEGGRIFDDVTSCTVC
jgi:hypothetical protein